MAFRRFRRTNLYEVTLGPEHQPRPGRVRHWYVGPDGSEEEAPDPSKLRIDTDKPGYLLVHLDDDDEWLADSHCDSVEEAMELATRNYGVRSDEWNPIDSP